MRRNTGMIGDNKSSNFVENGEGNPVTEKGDASWAYKTKCTEQWHADIISRLIQKSTSIEQANKRIMKLIEKKNILESKVKEKDDEICKLNDKILLLTKELGVVKKDYVQALQEVKMLKGQIHKSVRNNEIIEQKQTLIDKMQTELSKTSQSLVDEKLKNKRLEKIKFNPHKWRTMQYTDPHYYEILQKKNHLQKELQKKLNLLASKDAQLKQNEESMKKLQDMLKRRPFNLLDDPNEQMMEYYKTICLQKEKIKSLTAQVNMFESLVSDQYNRNNQRYKLTARKY